jgi:hypothetical protein
VVGAEVGLRTVKNKCAPHFSHLFKLTNKFFVFQKLDGGRESILKEMARFGFSAGHAAVLQLQFNSVIKVSPDD